MQLVRSITTEYALRIQDRFGAAKFVDISAETHSCRTLYQFAQCLRMRFGESQDQLRRATRRRPCRIAGIRPQPSLAPLGSTLYEWTSGLFTKILKPPNRPL